MVALDAGEGEDGDGERRREIDVAHINCQGSIKRKKVNERGERGDRGGGGGGDQNDKLEGFPSGVDEEVFSTLGGRRSPRRE